MWFICLATFSHFLLLVREILKSLQPVSNHYINIKFSVLWYNLKIIFKSLVLDLLCRACIVIWSGFFLNWNWHLKLENMTWKFRLLLIIDKRGLGIAPVPQPLFKVSVNVFRWQSSQVTWASALTPFPLQSICHLILFIISTSWWFLCLGTHPVYSLKHGHTI